MTTYASRKTAFSMDYYTTKNTENSQYPRIILRYHYIIWYILKSRFITHFIKF